MIATLLSLVPVFLLGYLIVANILPRSGWLERLSLGFGIGLGVFTFLLFVIMAIGVHLNVLIATLVALVSIALAAWFFARRHLGGSFRIDWRNLNMSFAEQVAIFILLALIGYLLITSLQIGTYWPVRAWDALTEYDFRARVFAQTGTLDLLHTDPYYVANPLITSLAHTWGYLIADALFPFSRPQIQTGYLINGTTVPVLIYWFFYLCMLVAFYQGLRRGRLNRVVSLLFVAALASTPQILESSTLTLTEVPFSYYLLLGMVYLYLWLRDRQLGDVVISGLMFGLGAWTRPGTEIFVAGAMLVLALYSWQERRFKALSIFVLLYLSFDLAWRLYVSYGAQLSTGFYESMLGIQFNAIKLKEVLDDLQQAFITMPEVALMWSFFTVVLLANLPFIRQRKVDFVPLMLALWCILALFGAMYAVSIRISVDIARYMSHLWPWALYACAVSPLFRFLLTSQGPLPNEGSFETQDRVPIRKEL